MRCFLDSSVLIAALSPDERHHEACKATLLSGEHVIYSHALLECFSTLTARIQASADTANILLRRTIVPRVEIVSLTPTETLEALSEARLHGVRGGGVYDYMHFAAAKKAGVGAIITLNTSDFMNLVRKVNDDPEIRLPI
jgi:predicted nucleic acid-binding protein